MNTTSLTPFTPFPLVTVPLALPVIRMPNERLRITPPPYLSTMPPDILLNSTIPDNGSDKGNGTKVSKYGSWEVVIISFLTAVTAIVTVLGNILVLTSFVVERALRQPSNYFIASLAVTDLLIGLFSMPAYSTYLVLERWPMPNILCDLWLSLDYTVCLVSQYNVLLITIDRFCSVKIPAKYRNWRAKKKVQIMVISTWIIPSAIFFTIHLGWDHILGRRVMEEGSCEAQYIKANPTFNVVLIFGYFWSTMVVLLALYAGIYQTAFTLQRKSQAKHQKMQQMVRLGSTGVNKVVETTGKQTGFLTVHTLKQQQPNDVSVVFNSTTVTQGKTTSDTDQGAMSPTKPDNSGSSERDGSSSPTFPSDTEAPDDGKPKVIPVGPAGPATLHKKPPAKGGTTARQHNHVFRDIRQRVALRQPHPAKSRGTTEMIAIVPKLQPPPKPLGPRKRRSKDGEGGKPNLIDLTPESEDDPQLTPVLRLRSSSISRSLPAVDKSLPRGSFALPCVSQPMINTSTLQTILLAKELNDEIRLLFAQRGSEPREQTQSASGGLNDHGDDNAGFVEPVWIPRVPFPVRFDELPSVLLQPFTGRTPLNNASDWRYIDQESLKSPNSSIEGTQNSTPTNRSSINSPLVLRDPTPTPPKQVTPKGSVKSVRVVDIPTPQKVNGGSPVQLTSAALLKLARPPPRVSVKPEVSDIGEESTRYDSDQRSANHLDQESIANHISAKTAMDGRNNSERLRQFGRRLRQAATRNSKKKSIAKRQQSRSENRARKALKTITFIMGAFVLCWTPWHICATIEGFCNGCVNPDFYALSYWLCYLNSPINPFCYALANQQFKKTFIRVLKFDLHRT